MLENHMVSRDEDDDYDLPEPDPDRAYDLARQGEVDAIHAELVTTFRGQEYWRAYSENYDGPESPLGTGYSRADAIADLREQLSGEDQ